MTPFDWSVGTIRSTCPLRHTKITTNMADGMATTKEATEIPEVKVVTHSDMEAQLDDDKHVQPADFNGATLQLDSGTGRNEASEAVVVEEAAKFSRDRPGSSISRKSVTSITSKTSVNKGVVRSKQLSMKFFCRREGAFENAVEQLKVNLNPEIDGELRGAWMLTEIDHWDNDHERLIMVTDYSMIVNRYDFVTMKVLTQKRVLLHMIDTVKIGDFIYPSKSLMWSREHGGVQCLWNRGVQPSFGQRWNPWCLDIPWMTFAHHPLHYHEDERDTTLYDVDDFIETLCQTINHAYLNKGVPGTLNVEEGPVEIQTYASLSSMVFNQSHIGFSLDRGGVSF